MVSVHNFSYGLLNPLLGYAVSCLGAFLGLRCVTRARAHDGVNRVPWLLLAAVSIGATGIWAMHFIAMLGFTIPGHQILYNVPITIASMLLAILVVGIGLFIVGYGKGGWVPLLGGGVIIGLGVASMHYMGMAAMSMPFSVHYRTGLVVLSVVIAIVAGTAGLWAGTKVRSTAATLAASLIMGAAVTGMHYTGIAAMRVYPGTMPTMSGYTAFSFLVPLLLGLSLVTFVLSVTISLSPTEDEIHANAMLQRRIAAGAAAGRHTAAGRQTAPGSQITPGPRPQRPGRRLQTGAASKSAVTGQATQCTSALTCRAPAAAARRAGARPAPSRAYGCPW